MGQEVGWYLRLSRASTLEVVVQKKLQPSIVDQAEMNPAWSMTLTEEGEFLRAIFTRKSKGA